MRITEKVMSILTGRECVDSLIGILTEASSDFADDHRRFQEAIKYFVGNHDARVNPSVDDVVNAINRQAVSNWLFSGWLGFKANMDHFMDPIARTFLDVDNETYLRERIGKTLPDYVLAQAIIDDFCRQLNPEQKHVFEDMICYISHLETIVPKIAHYHGYLLGNELHRYMIPGYQPDARMTIQYSMALERVLNFELS